jgi:hypothetical protein
VAYCLGGDIAMGTYYQNSHFLFTDQTLLANALHSANRRAYILPKAMDSIIVLDEECSETLNDKVTDEFASLLSKQLSCVCISVVVAFTRDLWMQVHLNGQRVDFFAHPIGIDYLSGSYIRLNGDPEVIASALGRKNCAIALRKVLMGAYDEAAYLHHAILQSLNIPTNFAGIEFRDVHKVFEQRLDQDRVSSLSSSDVEKVFYRYA